MGGKGTTGDMGTTGSTGTTGGMGTTGGVGATGRTGALRAIAFSRARRFCTCCASHVRLCHASHFHIQHRDFTGCVDTHPALLPLQSLMYLQARLEATPKEVSLLASKVNLFLHLPILQFVASSLGCVMSA